jgi:hypothetical protein
MEGNEQKRLNSSAKVELVRLCKEMQKYRLFRSSDRLLQLSVEIRSICRCRLEATKPKA